LRETFALFKSVQAEEGLRDKCNRRTLGLFHGLKDQLLKKAAWTSLKLCCEKKTKGDI